MKKFTFSAMLILAGLLIAMVLLEVMVRVLGLAQQTTSFYESDPVLGSRHVPYAKGVWRKKEFAIDITFNGEGFRDRDHAVAKPEGVRRIIVLGDSYVEAMQVELPETFYSILEKKLIDRPGEGKAEILNFGVSGFGIPQDYFALKQYGYKYEPDLVILAVTTGNDIRNAHPELELDKYRPYFLFNEEGEMYLQPPQQQAGILPSLVRDTVSFLFPQSYIYVAQVLGPRIWTYRTKKQKSTDALKPEAPKPAISLDTYVYGEPYTKQWADAWKASLGVIKMMNRELNEQGAKLLVVVLTDSDGQINGSLQKQLDRLKDGNLQWDAERPVKILKRFCRKEKIAFLPLLSGFRQEYQRTKERFHFANDGHWNKRGHELAAVLIYEKINKDGLLK